MNLWYKQQPDIQPKQNHWTIFGTKTRKQQTISLDTMQKSMSGKINTEIEECVRNNVTWQKLPIHLKQVNKFNSIHLSFRLQFFFLSCLLRRAHEHYHTNFASIIHRNLLIGRDHTFCDCRLSCGISFVCMLPSFCCQLAVFSIPSISYIHMYIVHWCAQVQHLILF